MFKVFIHIVRLASLPMIFIGMASHVYGKDLKAKSSKRPVIVATDIRCPYICSSSSKQPGYITEVFNKIGKRENVEFRFIHTSRKYGKKLFSKQNVDILLFGDDIFYNEIQAKKEFAVGRVEVGRIKPAVFSQKMSEFGIKNKIVTKNNWPILFGHNRVIMEPFYFENHWLAELAENIEPERTDFKSNITKLQYGEADFIIDDENQFNFKVRKLGKRNSTKKVGTIFGDFETLKLYALTNEHLTFGDSMAARVSSGIAHLRRKGQLKSILGKYKLKDWVARSRQFSSKRR